MILHFLLWNVELNLRLSQPLLIQTGNDFEMSEPAAPDEGGGLPLASHSPLKEVTESRRCLCKQMRNVFCWLQLHTKG